MAGTADISQLLLQIEATTEILRRELQRGRRDIDDFTDDADRNARRIEQRFDAMGKKIGGALKTGVEVGAAALAAGFVVAAKASFDLASSLGETAQQLGVGTKFLQEYRFAATQSGSSVEEADKAIGKFGLTVGKARGGSKEATEALAKFGITARDLATLDTAQLFAKFADGAARIGDPTRLAAGAVEVFGKGARAIIPVLQGGSKGLNEFADAAERKGLIISDEAIANMDALADKGAEIKEQFTSQLANAIGENSEAFTQLGAGLSAAAVGALKFAATDPERIKQVAAAIAGAYTGGRIAGLPGAVAGGLTAGVFTDPGFQNRAAGLTEVVRRKGLIGATVLGGNSAAQNEAYADPRKLAAIDRASVVAAARELAARRKKGSPTGLAAFFDTSNSAGEIAAAQKRLDIARKFAAESAAAVRALDAAKPKPKAKAAPPRPDFDVVEPPNTAALAAARKAKSDADRAAKDRRDDAAALARDKELGAKELFFERQSRLTEFTGGGNLSLFGNGAYKLDDLDRSEAFLTLQAKIADEAERARDAGSAFVNDLSSGLADALVNGKSIGDVLVNSLKRAAAEALANGLFKLIGGGTGGELFGKIGKILGFADGGVPPAGQVSLVGERGPELLIGNGRALVQPIPRVIGGGGGGGGGGGNTYQSFDLRGALVADNVYRDIQAMGAQAAQAGAVGGARLTAYNSGRQARRQLA